MNESLKDIRDIFQWSDYIWYFLPIVLIIAILIVFFKKRDKNISQKELYLQELKKLDFNNTKISSYKATKYIRFLAKTQKEKEKAAQIIKMLERYKYVKNPPKLDQDIKSHIEIFINMVLA
jgi:ATP-dependent Zn protease